MAMTPTIAAPKSSLKFILASVGSGVVLGFLLLEAGLRVFLGLGHPPLVEVDPQVGYYFRPNQDITRFGHHIVYNQFSQRSGPISLDKPPGVYRILLVGDSVLNGGTPTDQKETISELVKAHLNTKMHRVETLAASAGGWSIENRLGYLKKFGTLHSDLVVLQIGTEDLNQYTTPISAVADNPDTPTHDPLLATEEAWDRYLWPRIRSALPQHPVPAGAPTGEVVPEPVQFERNMAMFGQIEEILKRDHLPFVVLFNPTRSSLLPKFAESAMQRQYLDLLRTQQIPMLDLADRWSKRDPATVARYYRDEFHFTVEGDHDAADALSELILARFLGPGGAR
jgi:hypothetical protein